MGRKYIDESQWMDSKGRSRWISPVKRGYKMQCCDCGLVHTVDFRINKNWPEFRMARDNRATAAIRREAKKGIK